MKEAMKETEKKAVKEIAVQFGEQDSLTGVLTLPENYTRYPIVVLTTVGFTTRFGPARVHTLLARQLAQAGVACLRYDLDSLGDSGNCYAHIPLKDRTLVEVGHALDFLQESYGVQQFILAGICSGGEASFRRAAIDDRVVGAIMVDPFAVQTPDAIRRYFFFRVKRRIFRALGWFEYHVKPNRDDDVDLVNYQYMEHAEIEPILKKLLDKKLYIHMVYTATMQENFNHPSQLQQAFPALPIKHNVLLDWLPQTTHSPIFVEQVQLITTTILNRLKHHFAGVK